MQVFLLPAQDFYPLIATAEEDQLYYAEIFKSNNILALVKTEAKISNFGFDTTLVENYETLVEHLPVIDNCFSELIVYNDRLETIEKHKFYSTKDSIIIYQNMVISKEKEEIYLWGTLHTAVNKTKKLLVLDFNLKEKQHIAYDDSTDFYFINGGVVNHFIINNFGNLVTRTKEEIIEIDLEGNIVNSAENFFLTFHQNKINQYVFPSSREYYISDSTFQNINIKIIPALIDLGASLLTFKYKFSSNNSFFLYHTVARIDENCNTFSSNDVILKFNTQTNEYYPFYIDSISGCTRKKLGSFSLDFYNTNYIYIANKYSDCGFINIDKVDSTNVCNIEFINVKCIDRNGLLHWSKDFGGDAAYYPAGVIALPDSGCVVLVKRNEREINTVFESDLYYTKLDKNGNIVKPLPVSITEPNTNNQPNPQIYPNPAKKVLHISHIPQSSKPLQIEIFDLTGKLVLSQKIKDNTIQISHLSKGMYTYTFKQNKKLLSSDKLLKF